MKNYKEEREKRKTSAVKHVVWCGQNYSEGITESVEGTKVYTKKVKIHNKREGVKPCFNILDMDSVEAAVQFTLEDCGKIALLNFASYRNPGGGFLKGSMAQEEFLCHKSILYNVIGEFDRYYDWNNQNLNRSLYMERALYSPNIIFFDNGLEYKINVITCACPNKSAALKYKNISEAVNSNVLRGRIKFVLDIAEENGIDTLILGAYGCGVFGQDPNEVANIFREYLEDGKYGFKKVVFAIPYGRNGVNLYAFEYAFETPLMQG